MDAPETTTLPRPFLGVKGCSLDETALLMEGSLTLTSTIFIHVQLLRESALFRQLTAPAVTVYAHCDLPCGVYDPAQAKIEAQSVKACIEKFHASDDAVFKQRAVAIKEDRSNLVKEHLWVLWTDYFKPNHFEAHPNLHALFNEATKLAGAAGTKGTMDVAVADKLLTKIDEIAEIFWATKK